MLFSREKYHVETAEETIILPNNKVFPRAHNAINKKNANENSKYDGGSISKYLLFGKSPELQRLIALNNLRYRY